jgi:hypothetical protein
MGFGFCVIAAAKYCYRGNVKQCTEKYLFHVFVFMSFYLMELTIDNHCQEVMINIMEQAMCL